MSGNPTNAQAVIRTMLDALRLVGISAAEVAREAAAAPRRAQKSNRHGVYSWRCSHSLQGSIVPREGTIFYGSPGAQTAS